MSITTWETAFANLPEAQRADARAVAQQLGTGRIGVAFSGGVDSAVVLAVARHALGRDNAVGIIAVSPSLARTELERAREVAALIGTQLIEVETHELERPEYAANPVNRCFFCKDEFFSALDSEFLNAHGLDAVAYGENADDAVRPDRPGARAATDHAVLRPLAAAGVTKDRVRLLARALGLPVWDKPAAPCLASRIPHGEPVTREKLAAIEQAEEVLHSLGFSECRVRHHGEMARIELPESDLPAAVHPETRQRIVQGVRACGFRNVTLDLRGMQSGAFTLQVLNRHG